MSSPLQTILEDGELQQLALAVVRNELGPNEPLSTVLAAENVDPLLFPSIKETPTYKAYYNKFLAELKDSGFSFAAKCRVLAEELLPTQYHIATDADQPAAARIKAVENLVKWGNLEPKADANPLGSLPQLQIVIDLGSKEAKIIDITPQNAPPLPPAEPLEVPSETLIFSLEDAFSDPS